MPQIISERVIKQLKKESYENINEKFKLVYEHSTSNSSDDGEESLIEKINKRIANNEFWFSLEFFPPRTANGAANLISKLEFLGSGNPLFCDITWHPAGDPANLEKTTSSMKIASVMRNYCLLETMLHITCVNIEKEIMRNYLEKAKSLGIRNLLALRGGMLFGITYYFDSKFLPVFLNYFMKCYLKPQNSIHFKNQPIEI